MADELCHEHSGCMAKICALEKDNTKQWDSIMKSGNKVDGIMMRLNVVLGSMIVACVMLVINMIIK